MALKEVPLTDKPGGKVIGQAVVDTDSWTVTATVTDPEWQKRIQDDVGVQSLSIEEPFTNDNL